MIRFKCPACQTILKVLDEGAGSKIRCPKCGQRMLAPAANSPLPAKPAANNATALGQLATAPASAPAQPARVVADELVLLGLRKDADLEGGSEEQLDNKPARSWSGTLCALLALALAISAMPAAVVHHPLLGASLAACGVALALFAAFKSLFRKGLGLAAVALILGGSVLFSIVTLAGGPRELLHPVKDRLAAVSQQGTQARKEERPDRPKPPKSERAETKSGANQVEQPRRADRGEPEEEGVARRAQQGEEKEEPRQREEREEQQPSPKRPNTPSSASFDRLRSAVDRADQGIKAARTKREQEPAPTAEKPAPAAEKPTAKKETQLSDKEASELSGWVEKLDTELSIASGNELRYRTILQKAKEKAQAYTRDFTERKASVGLHLTVAQIKEDWVIFYRAAGIALQEGEPLRLKVGQGISKDAAIELKRGQALNLRADIVEVAIRESGTHVLITVTNLRLDYRQKGRDSAQSEGRGTKSKSEDDGQPKFDPDDLQRTARWGCAVVDKLWQERDNAIRYRDALEKLSKEVNAHEGAKVCWGFVVASIGEQSVQLCVDPVKGNTICSGRNSLVVWGVGGSLFPEALTLNVGQGISRDKAAQLKPGAKITVSAKVAELRVDLGSLGVSLKDLQAAEERKQPRSELQKRAQGETAIAAAHKHAPLPSPGQKEGGQPQTKAQLLKADAIVEGRLAASEEELHKQLREVPELRLVNDLDVQALHKSADSKSVMGKLHQALVVAGLNAGLPLRDGAQARLQPSAALVVEELSKSLRDIGFVSGVPSPGSRRGFSRSQENRPLDKVAEFQKWCDDKQIEKANAALPTLLQMLQVEKPPLRLLLVRELAKVENRGTTIVLSLRALFDLDPEVRALAVKSLEGRSSNQYLPFLLKALRYPWSPVADHAALALCKLKTTGIESQLVKLLEQPNPSVPVFDKKTKKMLVPELVRLNHMRNCVLCHAPSADSQDGHVRGLVPIPGEPLPVSYYAGQSGNFVRADTTFLRQDFSAILKVEGADPWPTEQRFDFVVRTRVVKQDEMPAIANKTDNNYPQREAVLYALRGLTGKDAGESAEKWREMLGIAKDDTDAGQDKKKERQ